MRLFYSRLNQKWNRVGGFSILMQARIVRSIYSPGAIVLVLDHVSRCSGVSSSEFAAENLCQTPPISESVYSITVCALCGRGLI